MVKKRSASRGFMTEEEVSEHLKPFSGSLEGSDAKVAYINKALAKPKLLQQQTRVNLRRNLADIHNKRYNYVDADLALIENGGEDYKKAIEDLKTREGNPQAADALEKYNEFEAAARIYANMGYSEYNQRSSSNIDFDKVRKTLTRAADLYEKAGQLDYAADAIIRAHIGTHKDQVAEGLKYGALIEKAAEKEEHLSQKVRYFQEARERYQIAGKTAKVLAIGKKLSPLEVKFEAEKVRRGYAAIGIAGAGLLGGAFFSSTKLTGNVIGMSTQTSSIIGIVLLIIGIIAGYFWLRNKRSSKKVVVSVPVKKKSISKKK